MSRMNGRSSLWYDAGPPHAAWTFRSLNSSCRGELTRVGPQYRFGAFTFDPAKPALSRNGRTVRLRPQSYKLLSLLLSRPGETVSREEIQRALWGGETFVDFEQGVNHCVKQIREMLRDSAESPRYIETLPRRGYRFIAPVEVIAIDEGPRPQTPAGSEAVLASGPISQVPGAPTPGPGRFRRQSSTLALRAAAAAGAALAVVAGVVYALRSPGTATPRPITLAVVPFTASGIDPAVGIGLADAISARLAHQRFAPVRSGHGFGRQRGDTTSTLDRARRAGVTLILGGEVSRSGDELAVVTELTEVASGTRTWSGRFRVRTNDLFSIENVVAERVVLALELRVAAAEQDRLRRRYTQNAAAYEDYLRGRAALVEYTPEGTRRAVAAFESALTRDSGYVLARAGRAMACADMYLRFAAPADVDRWGQCAESEARMALDGDPDLAEAHLARAAVARKREFDWGDALAASRRALVLNPNLDQAHFIAAAAYYHLGYMEEALIEMERGRRLHGQDLVEPLRIEALVALFSGSFAPALAHLETVSRRSSQSIGDTYLALAYYYTGNGERARPMLEALASHPSASTAARAAAALAGILAAQGEREAARRMVDRVVSHPYRDHHVAYSLGAAYAQLGESPEAVRWLGTAADTGFPCLIWFERDPLLEPIRQDAQFRGILARVQAQRQLAMSRLPVMSGQ